MVPGADDCDGGRAGRPGGAGEEPLLWSGPGFLVEVSGASSPQSVIAEMRLMVGVLCDEWILA